MSINIASITAKLNTYTGSSAFKQKAGGVSEEKALIIATDAGEQLAACITDAIGSTLNEGAAAAVGGVYSNFAYKSGENQYTVEINIDQNFRPSLCPEEYSGIDDMAAMLNEGYAASNYVYGIWHGRRIKSLITRKGANFVWKGISNFYSTHTGNYEIIDIDVDEGRFKFL